MIKGSNSVSITTNVNHFLKYLDVAKSSYWGLSFVSCFFKKESLLITLVFFFLFFLLTELLITDDVFR